MMEVVGFEVRAKVRAGGGYDDGILCKRESQREAGGRRKSAFFFGRKDFSKGKERKGRKERKNPLLSCKLLGARCSLWSLSLLYSKERRKEGRKEGAFPISSLLLPILGKSNLNPNPIPISIHTYIQRKTQ